MLVQLLQPWQESVMSVSRSVLLLTTTPDGTTCDVYEVRQSPNLNLFVGVVHQEQIKGRLAPVQVSVRKDLRPRALVTLFVVVVVVVLLQEAPKRSVQHVLLEPRHARHRLRGLVLVEGEAGRISIPCVGRPSSWDVVTVTGGTGHIEVPRW